MDSIKIYNQLWNEGDEFASSIATNDSILPCLRAIAFCILRDYDSAKNIYEGYSNSGNEYPNDIFRQELQLMLKSFDASSISLFQDEAETVFSQANWAVFSRLILAGSYELKKEHQKALKLYENILSQCPLNISAIAGSIRVYIHEKNERAILLLKEIGENGLLEGFDSHKRVYWRLLFLNYWMIVKSMEIAIAISISGLALAFLPIKIGLMFLAVLIGICLIFVFFVYRRLQVNYSRLVRLCAAFVFSWLVGYGTKLLFVFLEGL